jgi:hypothetical protein
LPAVFLGRPMWHLLVGEDALILSQYWIVKVHQSQVADL